MSADNWAQCPRCRARRENAADEAARRVAEIYGQVSVVQFDAARDEANRLRNEVDGGYTFREDYEIGGADEGVVEVIYSGACRECGLSTKFTHAHVLDWQEK